MLKDGKSEGKVRKANVAYKNPSQMPRERDIDNLKIFVGKSELVTLDYLTSLNLTRVL